MREFVKHVVTSLREDDHWKFEGRWVRSTKLKLAVWTASGFFFLHLRIYDNNEIHSKDIYCSLREKAALWWAVRGQKKAVKKRREEQALALIIERRLAP